MIYRPGLSVMNQLVEKASRVTQFRPAAIRGPSRERSVAHVRFALMALAREKGLSTPAIARGLGRKDHTTVLSGLQRAAVLRNDPDFSALVQALEAE